jgi:hypothetical protein
MARRRGRWHPNRAWILEHFQPEDPNIHLGTTNGNAPVGTITSSRSKGSGQPFLKRLTASAK